MIYRFQTARFGELQVAAKSKGEAATVARRFGDYHGLRRATFAQCCNGCDSKPCCCPRTEAAK